MQEIKKLQRPHRLVLVRHGESKANAVLNQIIQGEIFSYPPEFATLRDWDINLTETGKSQAYQTGTYLRKNLEPFDLCYVSPQQRTRETFEKILEGYENLKIIEYLKAHTRFESRLREKDHGAVNFLAKDEIKRFFPHEFDRREREGKILYRPLGGESWYDVKDLRVGSFLNSAYRDNAGKNILVVSHSIVINCFRMKLQRLEEAEMFVTLEKEPIDNCGIVVFESDLTQGGKLVLKEWNTLAYPKHEATSQGWQP